MKVYTVWFTLDCNLQCSYCYEGEKGCNLSISPEKLNQVINFIIQKESIRNRNFIVQIHGGEPLLEFDKIVYFVDQLKSFFKNKVFFRMTTNGTMLTKKKADFICNNINELLISIDGTEEAHNVNRFYTGRKGSFEQVIKGITKVIEKRQDTIARMTVCKNTIPLFSESILFLASIKFKRICYQLNMNEEWGNKDLNLFYEQICKVKEMLGDTTILKEIEIQNFKKPLKNVRLNCDGGTHSFTILPNGHIYPCSIVVEQQKYYIGDVINGVDEIKVAELECKSREITTSCLGCSHSEICNGNRCKIINEMYTGDAMLAWDYFCSNQNLNYRISKLFPTRNKTVLESIETI